MNFQNWLLCSGIAYKANTDQSIVCVTVSIFEYEINLQTLVCFFQFFGNLQAQITVTYGDKGRVMIGHLLRGPRVLHSLQPKTVERRKVNEQRELERKYLVKSELTSHQIGEKSGSNWKTKKDQ